MAGKTTRAAVDLRTRYRELLERAAMLERMYFEASDELVRLRTKLLERGEVFENEEA